MNQLMNTMIKIEVEDTLSNLAFLLDYKLLISDFKRTPDGVEGDDELGH